MDVLVRRVSQVVLWLLDTGEDISGIEDEDAWDRGLAILDALERIFVPREHGKDLAYCLRVDAAAGSDGFPSWSDMRECVRSAAADLDAACGDSISSRGATVLLGIIDAMTPVGVYLYESRLEYDKEHERFKQDSIISSPPPKYDEDGLRL